MSREYPENGIVISERLEPTFAYVIGRMFARCEHFRKEHDSSCVYFVDEMNNFYYALEAMNSLTVSVSTAIHASLAVGTMKQIFSNYCRENLKFCPILDIKPGERRSGVNFRTLANIEIDMSCIFDKRHKLKK